MVATAPRDGSLAARLDRALAGEVLFDRFSRGRYATDASIYQVEPVGVVVPRSQEDLVAAMEIGREEGVSLLPRGGGTSQCGQTVNHALVMDCSKHLDRIISIDPENMRAVVEPGIALDHLNAALKPYGLFFPVDVSTASRATIGGMTANNSCGGRSIHYGIMVDNVLSIDAVLPTGEQLHFGPVPGNSGPSGHSGVPGGDMPGGGTRYRDLVQEMRAIAGREAGEIAARFPKLMRRVGGYNIDTIDPAGHNMASLLVGSEGTLAAFRQIELKLHRIPAHRVMGVCHFPTFYKAMDATRHIVTLKPHAVELIDRNMIELARDIPVFRPMIAEFVKGEPDSVLVVEFAGEDHGACVARLRELEVLMADLGYPGAVVDATAPALQATIGEVRRQGLNIMMSMKQAGKPVSFIEDCAVPLEDLAEFTDRLTGVFRKHGTRGTWYAHASVGCLHVRPVLNLKEEGDVKRMRAIAEAAFEMVREYKGSHSGEHGDGIVRSEFHGKMFGERLVAAFADVKRAFDPACIMNPGRIVDPPKMDDRSLFRFRPDYAPLRLDTALDWSEWGGFSGAVEMCNNNGACRKRDAGVMCPSFRATRNEKDLTRGRANTLRLALSGQLGPEALVAPEMKETMALCVSCKGCKRECPTGVDMARMKIEFLYHYTQKHGLGLKDRLISWLPRYAEAASRFSFLANARDTVPGLKGLSELLLGFSAERSLPVWSAEPFRSEEADDVETLAGEEGDGRDVVLLNDTFSTYFEPENLRAALRVLGKLGYRVHVVDPRAEGGRHLCCGRTFLASGLVDQAKEEARRMIAAYLPWIRRGVPVVGLEPSCLFTLRDEFRAMLPGADTELVAGHALLFEEFIAREQRAGRISATFRPVARKALVHGHCHQKAFAAMGAVESTLALVPEMEVEIVKSGCCGMAGAFGYEKKNQEVSMAMAERDLLPAMRAADGETLLVADGTSCRHQIRDGAARMAVHVATVLDRALA